MRCYWQPKQDRAHRAEQHFRAELDAALSEDMGEDAPMFAAADEWLAAEQAYMLYVAKRNEREALQ